ncbi:MAG: ABC transporter ATP-binding protein [Phycisphaerales bacterium]|nr:ABC transporter ATP-binding protein [Phycisphaerales bacterium]
MNTRSNITTLKRMLQLGRPMGPQLIAIFLLDQFTWVLILASPLPVAMVLNVVTDKPALPDWLLNLVPGQWDKMGFVLLAVILQLALAILAMVQDALRHVLCTYTGEQLTLAFRSRLFAHAQRLSLHFTIHAGPVIRSTGFSTTHRAFSGS